MSIQPTISLATVGSLSDVLQEMPLVTPTDYFIETDAAQYLSSLSLFDSQLQYSKANQILNSNDANLVDILNRTLSQIDTSKIVLKTGSENASKNNTNTQLPPIIQSTLLVNPKLFNGALNGKIQQQQRDFQSNHQQYQTSSQPSSSALTEATESLASSSQKLLEAGTSGNPSSSFSSSSSSSMATFQNEYKVIANNDTNKISIKISKEPKDHVTINKFYAKKAEPVPSSSFYSSGTSKYDKKETKNMNTYDETIRKDPTKKKKDSSKQKNELGTWQSDIQSQLHLPTDFTPDLIAQLASEGYDITSGTSRKARPRQQATLVKSINAIEDSSDEEKADNASGDHSKARHFSNDDGTKSSNRNNRIIKPVVKFDGEDPNENPSYKRFNQLLDDLIDSYEEDLQQITKNRQRSHMIDEEEAEIPPEYLLTRQLCADLVQEAFKLNSYSIMYLVRKENLYKLQNLLYFNIKDGLRSLNFSNEESSKNSEQDKLLREILIEKLLRASDCSIISLIIMTSNQIPKELVNEDIIEQVSSFVKTHLTETIFPHYDAVYKTAAHAHDGSKNTKRKLMNQFNSSTGHGSTNILNNKTKQMQQFYNRMREILSLIGELVSQIDLTDTIIITLSSLSVMCFFVENINDLQLESLKILTNIFTRYSKHRQLVLDDILNSLVKLHPNKRNSRLYKCLNGDSIQMFSALLLQLIQCEVTTIDNFTDEIKDEKSGDLTFEEKETFLINSFEDSSQTAKKFLSIFFSKCKAKQADSDFRPIFENFIQDLLITVNKPEWPVSETILNLLGIILVSQIQNDQNDAYTRVNSLEYLGQIVSQLRKDSLEYQKNPDKVKLVLDKINPPVARSVSPTEPEEPELKAEEYIAKQLKEDELFNLQKALVVHLNQFVANDPSLQYSKHFLIGQWIKELNQHSSEVVEHDQERINAHSIAEQNRKRLYQLVDKEHLKTLETSAEIQVDTNESFVLSKYLSSLRKTLDKNFDYYLVNILSLSGGSSNESNTPTQVRSKAIKCLSLIIEADPQILLKQKVFSCVQANFMHQTISVREASVDLIGRFITLKPELTNYYYKLLSDRILDVGVSVRKRAIKIFRDVCINQPDFEHLSEICVKILRRIGDEDAIKKLVIDTFYSLWFSPINSIHRDQMLKRVLCMVDVVSEFNQIATNAQSADIFEQLFNSLIVKPSSDASASGSSANQIKDETTAAVMTNEQELQIQKGKETLKSCKQIVDCLIENVLNTEANTSSPHAYKRLVASFSTLYLLSKIKPENFINHAETLLPYLNIKSTNQNDNQIINSAAKILECVVPLLQNPSDSFLISLEESLCKLIFQGGMMIVSSCISCLGTVVNKLTKNYKLASDCFSKFYKNAEYLKKTVNKSKPLEQGIKIMIFRMLFTLGLLSKHFDIESPEFLEYKVCTKKELFSLFIFFIKGFEVDVQQKALIGLGSFLARYSEYMMKDEIKTLYHSYIKNANVPIPLKSQIFLNLTDYLNEEDRRNLAKSVELSKTHCKDDLKEMLDVQSGMASTIIQSYLKPILDSYLTANASLRINVFNCLSMILTQGLIYPIECVPYLIAMTTDQEKKVQSKSLVHLTNLQKAHPSFVQSKSIAGVNISFIIQKIIKNKPEVPSKVATSKPISDEAILSMDSAIRGYSCSEQGEILSLNHHLYSLLRTNRSYRRAFLQQLIKMFDDTAMYSNATLAHKLFICDNLAFFPYQLMDEPLYVIHQIDIIISITGINLLQTFKESLKNHVAIAESEKPDKKEVKTEETGESDMCINITCPDEADEKPTDQIPQSEFRFSSPTSPLQTQKKIIDDDEETFESVYENLPDNLAPIKDCIHKSQGCCLLLILKFFLKEIYSISEGKIQNYNPADTAKVNDRPIMSRKLNRKFNPKQIIEYMVRSNTSKENDDEMRRSLVKEYLEFKELIISIDQEETKSDDRTPSSGSKNNIDASKISAIQQKLLDGIEKTKVPAGSGTDSVQSTPRKVNNNRRRNGNSSCKKSMQKKKKRRRENSEFSSEDSESFMSDMDDDM